MNSCEIDDCAGSMDGGERFHAENDSCLIRIHIIVELDYWGLASMHAEADWRLKNERPPTP